MPTITGTTYEPRPAATPPAPATAEAPPENYRRMTDAEVTPAVQKEAVIFLNEVDRHKYGDEKYVAVDGTCYYFRIEPHYDNHVRHLVSNGDGTFTAVYRWEWHTGVSTFRPIEGAGYGCANAPTPPTPPSPKPPSTTQEAGIGLGQIAAFGAIAAAVYYLLKPKEPKTR